MNPIYELFPSIYSRILFEVEYDLNFTYYPYGCVFSNFTTIQSSLLFTISETIYMRNLELIMTPLCEQIF